MSNEIRFDLSLKYYYESLSDSIKSKKKSINVTRDKIMPTDPNRVTQVTKNIRTKSHPYLIGESELFRFYKLYKYKSKEEWDKADLDGKEFDDDHNYDKMLWAHIDWAKLYNYIIEDIKNMDNSSKLSELFGNSLLDYVPYAINRANFDCGEDNWNSSFFMIDEPINYLLYKHDIEERENLDSTQIAIDLEEFSFNMEISTEKENTFSNADRIFYEFENSYEKAVKWVYFTENNILKMEELFLSKFKGKNLKKFDKKFNQAMNDIMLEIVEQQQPTNSSFGLQAYNYMNEILTNELLNDEGGLWIRKTVRLDSYDDVRDGNYTDIGIDEEMTEVNLIDEYLDFAKEHLNRLKEFQKKFKKATDQVS